MPRKQTLTLIRGDDPTVNLTVTGPDDAAYPLTGQRIEILVKAHARTADTAALYVLSSEGDAADITITNETLGAATADFTNRLATAGKFWFRAYVASEGAGDVDRHTFAYGDLIIIGA